MAPSIHNYVTDIFAPQKMSASYCPYSPRQSRCHWNKKITVIAIKKMACPNNITAGNFLMDSLMGGSSSYRGEGYSGNPGMYIQTAADYGCSVMRNIEKVGQSLVKIDDVPLGSVSLSAYQDAPYLSSQVGTLGAGSKTGMNEEPVARCLHPCSFPAGNVKEEAFCCLYSDSGRAEEVTESATYIRLGDNSQSDQTVVSSPECFQTTQVYSRERLQFAPDFALVQPTTSVVSPSKSTESVGKPSQDAKLLASKGEDQEQRNVSKEKQAKTDSCSDNSDEDFKGKPQKHPLSLSLTHFLLLSPTHTIN